MCNNVYRKLRNEAKKMLSDKTSVRRIDLVRFRNDIDGAYEKGALTEKQFNVLADMLEEMQK